MGTRGRNYPPTGWGKQMREFEVLTSPMAWHPFGQDSLSLVILTGILHKHSAKAI